MQLNWKQATSLPWKKKRKSQSEEQARQTSEEETRQKNETVFQREKNPSYVIRQLAWFLLILVQMAVVHRLEVQAEEQVLRPVQQEIYYDYVEGAAEIPRQVTVTVREGEQETEAVCTLQKIEEEAAVWQEGFVLPITFHVYDADSYQFGSQIVSHSEEKPQLEGHEEALLEAAGLSGEQYRIRDIVWEGDSYTDENGQLCRDAAAIGDKLVRSCRAYYAGMAAFPASEMLSRPESAPESVSELETLEESRAESEKLLERGEQGPDHKNTNAEVHLATEDGSRDDRWKPSVLWARITRTLLVAVGIGAALFFLGLFLLGGLRIAKIIHLWYINRRRKDKED